MYLVINSSYWLYDNYYFSNKINHWFDKNLYQFYTSEEIEELGYSANTQEELIELLSYNDIIPSYSINLYKFDKNFIESYKNKKLSQYFAQIEDEERFDHIFRVYTENNNIHYFDELREFGKNIVIEWCKINSIRYKIE